MRIALSNVVALGGDGEVRISLIVGAAVGPGYSKS